jgi:tetratricopeptide (TPR) repeat protein
MRRKNAPFNPLINRRGVGWNNPFRSYHERWIEGYWSGQYADGLGWRQSGATLALAVPGDGQTRLAEAGLAGWGLLPWAYGPILYESGYLRYGNPYARRGPDRGVTEPLDFDEAQPVDPRGASATDPGASLASSAFTSARLVFMQHDYVRSLAWIDQALKLSPGDPALYQFRSLVLFATKRYDEAASALYAALAVEPGWNWTTLIDLYDTPDAYTEQLRALETFKQQHPRSAPARFVLAYHYLTAEHAAAALQQYKLVCELLPDDALSLQLSHKLDPAHRPSPNSADRAGAPPAKDGKIEGSWSARTRGGATLRVTFDAGGRFHWTISQGRIDRRIEGAWQKDGDQLTLTQDQIGGTMIGRAQWRDEHHFVFRLLGADSDDAGLSFALATN